MSITSAMPSYRSMIYRMRIYQALPARLEEFTALFLGRLLPVQLRHGARLLGRWQTLDHRVIALWEYDSIEDYHRIQSAVAADPDTALARREREALGELFTSKDETFMTSTMPPPAEPSP